jgi:hypothetical protein
MPVNRRLTQQSVQTPRVAATHTERRASFPVIGRITAETTVGVTLGPLHVSATAGLGPQLTAGAVVVKKSESASAMVRLGALAYVKTTAVVAPRFDLGFNAELQLGGRSTKAQATVGVDTKLHPGASISATFDKSQASARTKDFQPKSGPSPKDFAGGSVYGISAYSCQVHDTSAIKGNQARFAYGSGAFWGKGS